MEIASGSARTLTQKILDHHSLGPVVPGSVYRRVEVDVVLGHEATIALLIERFEASGLRIRHPDRCLFAADHFVPPATAERATILQKYIEFCAQQGVSPELFFRGISHQLMLEDKRCVPGALICGADSHTTMGGALGCFAAGFGTTDILGILVTGHAHLKVPPAVAITVRNSLPIGTLPKDLALWMMETFGEGGATGLALEWTDADQQLSIGARATVSNMAVDCGAKNAIWVPDDRTRDFMAARGIHSDIHDLTPDSDAPYLERFDLDLSQLEPRVALPGSPANVVPVSSLSGERVHQVVIGSCTSSDGEDIRAAAKALKGQKVAPGVRLVVTPSSQAVYAALIREGVILDLVDAGAMVTVPACGACGGIDKGILGAHEVCVSTSNRNFRGRMGHPDARVYLGSGLLAAAAALTGRVCDPREVLTARAHDALHSSPPRREGGERVRFTGAQVSQHSEAAGRVVDSLENPAILSVIDGPALVFGNEINTDELHPSVFYSLDNARVRAGFLRHVEGHEARGDEDLSGRIVLAGHTFGIGSSRETGAKVFRLAGIQAVVAVSFARIFQRNLMNLGIPALTCPALAELLPLEPNVPVSVQLLENGGGFVRVNGRVLELEPLDPYWREVLKLGGLVSFLGLDPQPFQVDGVAQYSQTAPPEASAAGRMA